MLEPLSVAYYLARARLALYFRDREKLHAWQTKRLSAFLEDVLPRAPFYRDQSGSVLEDLPIVDRSVLMREFDGLNTRGVCLGDALRIAHAAERSRCFEPTIDDVTVGLSSGTSGSRGVFLVSRQERRQWAGTILARMLSGPLLRRLISPWRPPLRVAFFLRANSNVYTTLSSRRLEFVYYDLLEPIERHWARVCTQQPDVLVGPASVLRELGVRALSDSRHFLPSRIISVAETLEYDDEILIRRAFGLPVHQIYQATEGFIAYTCECGSLHLNETFLHVEREWLDETRTRFHPIVTDFTRHTQLIVRYRLNDVLRVADRPCPCGSAEQTIAAVEGRADEVLRLPHVREGRLIAIFPDVVRRAMALQGELYSEYRIEQERMQLRVCLATHSYVRARRHVQQELERLWRAQDVKAPDLVFDEWQAPLAGSKRRRIRCLQPPEITVCTYS